MRVFRKRRVVDVFRAKRCRSLILITGFLLLLDNMWLLIRRSIEREGREGIKEEVGTWDEGEGGEVGVGGER